MTPAHVILPSILYQPAHKIGNRSIFAVFHGALKPPGSCLPGGYWFLLVAARLATGTTIAIVGSCSLRASGKAACSNLAAAYPGSRTLNAGCSSGVHGGVGARLGRGLSHHFYLSKNWFGVAEIGNGSNNIPKAQTNLPRQWSIFFREYKPLINRGFFIFKE